MKSFKITAQSYTSTHRIQKVVRAQTAEAALRSVWTELDDNGFYPLDAVAI